MAVDEAYEFKTGFNDLTTMLAEIQRLRMQCYLNIHSPTHFLMIIVCNQRQHSGCNQEQIEFISVVEKILRKLDEEKMSLKLTNAISHNTNANGLVIKSHVASC